MNKSAIFGDEQKRSVKITLIRGGKDYEKISFIIVSQRNGCMYADRLW